MLRFAPHALRAAAGRRALTSSSASSSSSSMATPVIETYTKAAATRLPSFDPNNNNGQRKSKLLSSNPPRATGGAQQSPHRHQGQQQHNAGGHRAPQKGPTQNQQAQNQQHNNAGPRSTPRTSSPSFSQSSTPQHQSRGSPKVPVHNHQKFQQHNQQQHNQHRQQQHNGKRAFSPASGQPRSASPSGVPPKQQAAAAAAVPDKSKPTKVQLSSAPITIQDLASKLNVPLPSLIKVVLKLGEGDEIPKRVVEELSGGRKSAGSLRRQTDQVVLSGETAELIAMEMGFVVTHPQLPKDRVRSTATMETPRRAPIVVVMGHVDHGKTTLLDSLRQTQVAAGEDGGITQSISAFRVTLKTDAGVASGLETVCFLDTPGHEAFSAMREHGAAVTDVVVLVVAATDGVMPQTVESLRVARKANLPVVVAVTKLDQAQQHHPELTSEEVQAQILDGFRDEGLDAKEDLFVGVVAPKGTGLAELCEAIAFQAEASELSSRADPEGPGEAVVLEARMDRSLGPVADVVVRWGTLKVGDFCVVGEQCFKIRALRSLDAGETPVKACPPSTPVRVAGFTDCPEPGEDLLVVADEAEGKRIVDLRSKHRIETEQANMALDGFAGGGSGKRYARTGKAAKDARLGSRVLTRSGIALRKRNQLESLKEAKQDATEKSDRDCPVILKADTEGSLRALRYIVDGILRDVDEKNEALKKRLDRATTEEEQAEVEDERTLSIVREGVGAVTDQDVEFAQLTGARILGFNVRVPGSASKKAKTAKVEVNTHAVIYHLVDELKAFALGEEAASSKTREKIVGKASILEVFDMAGKKKSEDSWKVAGCRIVEGTMGRSHRFRVLRNGVVICESSALGSLKVLKKDVDSVAKGAECGVALAEFEDFQKGDVIEAFETFTR